jgi:putative nucleotidyltransferase with HDIG domain
MDIRPADELPIQFGPRRADGKAIGELHKVRLWRYLPHVALTTLGVIALPVLVVATLRSQGVVTEFIPLLLVAIGVSFVISTLGAAIWKTRPGSGDILFGDLIVWGFVRRWRVDRRLSSSVKLLGLRGHDRAGADDLPPARKADLLEQLGSALEARDPYTHGHSRRVARHAATMARRMGLSRAEIARIRTAAAIHDVGKVETPREVLAKPGRLTDEEFEVIRRHPVDGARMVAALGDPALTEMVRHHHERLDGGGYPDGLRGNEIPLGARIIAVADTFDAITSARPYRPAKAHKMALDILRAESGSQLDRDAVEAFRAYYSGLRPVAAWAAFTSVPQRLFAGLFDDLGAGVASGAKVMAATTASVVAGAGAVEAVNLAHPPSSRASASAVGAVLAPGPGAQWHSGEAMPGATDRPPTQTNESQAGPRRSGASRPRAHASAPSPAGGPPSDPVLADGGGPSRTDGVLSANPGEVRVPKEATDTNDAGPAKEVRLPTDVGVSAEVDPSDPTPVDVALPKEVNVPIVDDIPDVVGSLGDDQGEDRSRSPSSGERG